MGMTQIAVKLPEHLVAAVDQLVADGAFASRSAAVRRGLEDMVDRQRRSRIDREFAEGFRRSPDTAQELADATRLAVGAIDDEPWVKWW